MSVATGFFGGIRSLCFSVVGAKMANDVRVKLFQAVIIQDIAFFDVSAVCVFVCARSSFS